MPKQSSTTKGEVKRIAILDAARACFIENGFKATSMQDILAATKLSAGALYRYYPGKESIVEAVVKSVLAELRSAFDDTGMETVESLGVALKALIRALERLDRANAASRLAIQVWAEVQRSPALAAIARSEMQPLVKWFERLVRSLQRRGKLPRSVSARQLAPVLMGTLQGFVVQRTLLGVDAREYQRGLEHLFRQQLHPSDNVDVSE